MKFVKRQEVVDAVRFDLPKDEKDESFGEYPVFYDPDIETGVPYLRIATPDGSRRADIGDWIVKSGNVVSVCMPDEFQRLYDSVNENFEKNAEGFLEAYKVAMKQLGNKELDHFSEPAGTVEYKNGEKFEVFVKICRYKKEEEKPVEIRNQYPADSTAGAQLTPEDSKTANV